MTDTAKAYVDSLTLEYRAEFVPVQDSRNAGTRTLNWRVSIGRPNGPAIAFLTTDYSQGIGHIPGFAASKYSAGRRLTLEVDSAVRHAIETGRSRFRADGTVASGYTKGRPIPAPELIDVLYCLVSDSDVLNYASFEEWADCVGYDPDSRKAEAVYRECMNNALRLRQIINLDEATEAFQDY